MIKSKIILALVLHQACVFYGTSKATSFNNSEVFVSEIPEIGYKSVQEFQEVWKTNEPEPFTLLRTKGIVQREEIVLVYVIETEGFFDFVFFSKNIEISEVLSFFIKRWEFVSSGILAGYIHFNEDYTSRFIEEQEFVDSLHGRSGTGIVAKHGNTIFNDFRAVYLKRYAKSLLAAKNTHLVGITGEAENVNP